MLHLQVVQEPEKMEAAPMSVADWTVPLLFPVLQQLIILFDRLALSTLRSLPRPRRLLVFWVFLKVWNKTWGFGQVIFQSHSKLPQEASAMGPNVQTIWTHHTHTPSPRNLVMLWSKSKNQCCFLAANWGECRTNRRHHAGISCFQTFACKCLQISTCFSSHGFSPFFRAKMDGPRVSHQDPEEAKEKARNAWEFFNTYVDYIHIHTYIQYTCVSSTGIYIYAFASYLQHFGSEYVHIYTYIYIQITN
jgi:hypothetical protein